MNSSPAGRWEKRFIQEGLRSNRDVDQVLAPQVGMIFSRWDLKAPCIKNSEYEFQTNKQKIPIVISTISHFWSPTLTTVWQSVFVSSFSIIYAPTPYTQKYSFLRGLNFFFVSCSQELGKFQIFWRTSKLWGPNLHFGRGGRSLFLP